MTKKSNAIAYSFSIIFWIMVWHFAAKQIHNELFLPSPLRVWEVFHKELLFQADFWNSIRTSLIHIAEGFFMGFFLGILLAVFSFVCKWIQILLYFPIKLIKTIPVASFVILILLWIKASALSKVIPFLMVLPTFYVHTLHGLQQTDKKLLEMTKVFGVSYFQKLRYLYLPQVLPHICAASSVAVGMAWKSGIAAEIIGLTQGTIGNRIYQSKLYLNTPELFAWTILVIAFSILGEWMIQMILQVWQR